MSVDLSTIEMNSINDHYITSDSILIEQGISPAEVVDTDGSGDIDKQEFLAAMDSAGLSEIAEDIFEIIDDDGDGTIEYSDYDIEEIQALAFSLTEVDGVDESEQTDGKQ